MLETRTTQSSIGVTWELIRMKDFGTLPLDLWNQNLHFSRIPEQYTLKFEKHCSNFNLTGRNHSSKITAPKFHFHALFILVSFYRIPVHTFSPHYNCINFPKVNLSHYILYKTFSETATIFVFCEHTIVLNSYSYYYLTYLVSELYRYKVYIHLHSHYIISPM